MSYGFSLVKSLQNVDISASVAGNASGANVDTTISSVTTTKSIIIVRHRDHIPTGSNIGGTMYWSLSSATNFRISGVNNSGGGSTTLYFNVTIVEFY